MTFGAAMTEVKLGQKVCARGWTDSSAYVCLNDGKLMINMAGEWHDWVISRSDLDATWALWKSPAPAGAISSPLPGKRHKRGK